MHVRNNNGSHASTRQRRGQTAAEWCGGFPPLLLMLMLMLMLLLLGHSMRAHARGYDVKTCVYMFVCSVAREYNILFQI